MSSRAGSLWRQIFNVQCPYKKKASVKATRASLCYSEPCWLFAFADMLWSRWIITFFTNKTQISNVFFNVCAVLKLKQNHFHTFHKRTDSLWASSIYGPPLQMIWPICFSWDRALVVVHIASYQLDLCVVAYNVGPLGYLRHLGPLSLPGLLGLHVLSGHMGLLGLESTWRSRRPGRPRHHQLLNGRPRNKRFFRRSLLATSYSCIFIFLHPSLFVSAQSIFKKNTHITLQCKFYMYVYT